LGSTEATEFAPEDIGGAIEFIQALPEALNRVYVEVWEESAWRFVYGDCRPFVPRLLELVTRGRRFRVRGVDFVQVPDLPSAYFRTRPRLPRSGPMSTDSSAP
jgi:hypothetical protein